MSETAVTRVTAYVASRKTFSQRRGEGIDTIPGYDRVHHLTLADLTALLNIIADTCDDHMTCSCGAHWCETCVVGDGSADCDPPHCLAADCIADCPPCAAAAADDHAADIAADVALERCEQP